MLNLVRANFYQVTHIPLFPLFVFFWIGVPVFPLSFLEWPAGQTLCSVLGQGLSMGGLAFDYLVFMPWVFTGNLKDGSVRNVMVGKTSRLAWCGAAAMTAALIAAASLLVDIAICGVYGYLVLDVSAPFDGWGTVVWWLACCLLLTAAALITVVGLAWSPALPVSVAVGMTMLAPELTYRLCEMAAAAVPPVGSVLLGGLPFTLAGLHCSLIAGSPIELWQIADLAATVALVLLVLVCVMRRKELK